MRITGGAFRSRALKAPKGSTTRPTADRAREALFSILHARGALRPSTRVLDLYAGSGALAFESLSRGAARAVLVEKDRAALATIAENARALEVGPRISVVQTAVERAKERLSREAPFDLIFADPPWATVTDGAALAAITPLVSLFAEGATFVLEHAASDEPPTLAGLELDDARRYGDTRLSFYATYETATAPGGTEHNR